MENHRACTALEPITFVDEGLGYPRDCGMHSPGISGTKIGGQSMHGWYAKVGRCTVNTVANEKRAVTISTDVIISLLGAGAMFLTAMRRN
jgi:hypothetical protein